MNIKVAAANSIGIETIIAANSIGIKTIKKNTSCYWDTLVIINYQGLSLKCCSSADSNKCNGSDFRLLGVARH